MDAWESLNWRRGALRYYVATVRCKLGPRETSLSPAALVAASRELGPSELEVGVRALCHMLDARGGESFDGHVHKDSVESAISYGVYGTTHLLGMAYAGELSYLRSLAADDEGDAAAWRSRALKLVHRYVYVVQVLMDGCGWSVDRPKELIALLGGQDALERVLDVEWTNAPDKVAAELARLGLNAPRDIDAADKAPKKATKDGGKRKGKKKR